MKLIKWKTPRFKNRSIVGCDWGALGNSTNTWSMSRKLAERNARHLWKPYRPYNGQWSDHTAIYSDPRLDNMLQLPDEFFVFLQPLHQHLQIKGNWMYWLNVSSCKTAVHCKHLCRWQSCGLRNLCFRLPLSAWHAIDVLQFIGQEPTDSLQTNSLHANQTHNFPSRPRSVKSQCFGIVRTISPSVPNQSLCLVLICGDRGYSINIRCTFPHQSRVTTAQQKPVLFSLNTIIDFNNEQLSFRQACHKLFQHLLQQPPSQIQWSL